MATTIVSGVGARYGVVFPLNTTTGLPNVDSALTVGTLTQGTLVEGIKDYTATDPVPQRFTHYGDDFPFAQDSLPATTVGSFTFSTAKSNLALDAVVEGNNVVAIDSLQARAGDTEKRGNEPLTMFATYRQALDTKKGSNTFGRLRQWQLRIYPSNRIATQAQSYGQGETPKLYEGTPTPVQQTPWNDVFTNAKWGNTTALYIDLDTDYQPRLYVGTGNGTVTKFALPHVPATTSSIHVFVDGTLTAPASVSLTDPSFTMTVAPGNTKEVFVINETNAPGNS